MKRLFIILLIVGTLSTAYANELRILGGISLARSTEPLEDYGRVDWSPYVKATLFGGAGGVGISFSLAPRIGLEIDCLLLQKGADVEISGIAGPFFRYHDRVNELSFPILLKLSITQAKGPYALAGGEVAWVISRDPKDLDYGFVFGIGVDIPFAKKEISLEGRFHLGMRDLRTDLSVLRKMRAAIVLLGFSW